MYDAEGFQVANPINRFAIGDRDTLKVQPRRLARSIYSEREPRFGQGIELVAGAEERPTRIDAAIVRAETTGLKRPVGSAGDQASKLARAC
jgi:hypothetical protein